LSGHERVAHPHSAGGERGEVPGLPSADLRRAKEGMPIVDGVGFERRVFQDGRHDVGDLQKEGLP
jgi:hypothetical protein